MANNPLYPGYSPKKEGAGSVNPIYPGYYSGKPISKRPDWRGNIKPAEYNFDYLLHDIDEVGKDVANTPIISPKWYADRIVDDWKNQLKVSVTPNTNMDVTELDDYATDDLAGATTSLSLKPSDWGIGNKKGFEQTKKQIKSTLKAWVKETTGVNLNNLLDSDFSDIQNALNEKLWSIALGYGEENAANSERIGGKAVADRTTAMFKDVRESAYTDEYGKRLSPLDLKHKQKTNPDGTINIVEDRIYDDTVSAAISFANNRGNVRDRDKLHTSFLSEAVKAVNKDISNNLKPESLSSKQNAAVNFFNTEVGILKSMEAAQKIAEDTAKELIKRTETQRKSWRDPNWDKSKFIDGKIEGLKEAKTNIEKLKSSLNKDIPSNKIEFLNKEIEKYNTHIDNLLKTLENGKKNNYEFSRNDIKKIKGPTPSTNFNGRTTFQDSLGGNLRRDMERSILSNKESDIGSVINAEGSNLRAKKIAPVMYRLRQDRIHYATKEVLEQFDKGGLAQVAETYVWNNLKNKMSARLERASSGSIIGDTLKRTNYFGLKIDDRGTPTDQYFEKHPWKKASFERKFLNKTDVKLDKELSGLVGDGIFNKIRVTSLDVHKDRLEHLENLNKERVKKGLTENKIASLNLIGDKTLNRFKLDSKNIEDQILLARLINNDRSEDALEKLSQKMFGYSLSSLSDKDREDMGKFFTKIDYANNWVYQKSGGKIKALEMQKGFLNLTNEDFLKSIGVGDEEIKEIIGKLGGTSLRISKGEHLDIFKNNKVLGFLNSTIDDKDKQKFLEDMLNLKGKNQTFNGYYTQKIFGKNILTLSISEREEWNKIQDQFNKFSSWIESQRSIFGDKVDDPAFRLKLFMQFKKQGIEGFSKVNVNQNDKSFLLIKNIFQKNNDLNKGYKLTDKRYVGRLEKINNKMQSLQIKWQKSKLGRFIKFIKNWQEILSEKIIALLSKLIAKLAGITAASLGPLAVLLPIIQALAEKVLKKALDYGSAFIKAIFKLDFDSIDKILQEDFKKIVQLLLLMVPGCVIVLLPVFLLVAVIITITNPVDFSRSNFEGYGAGNFPTSGEPDPRVFGCGGMCGGVGECVNSYGGDNFTDDVGLGGFYYNQFDPRWRNVPIGNSGSTIGPVGCFVTSVAMVYTFFGQPVTPDVIAGQTYRYNGANMSDHSVENVISDDNYSADETGLKQFFEDHPGGIAILGLFVNPAGGSTQHYVVISGYDPSRNDFTLYDSARGPDACLKQEYPGISFLAVYGYYQEDGSGTCNIADGEVDDCGKSQDPICNNQPNTGSDLADLALKIACDLQPGFGCLYNKPDFNKMDSKYSYSGNIIASPGAGVPLWNQTVYDQMGGTDISEGEWDILSYNYPTALFWCTWLPTKVYNQIYGDNYGSNYAGGMLNLGARAMCEQTNLNFIKDYSPQPGDIACFVTGEEWHHVGVVYSVDADSIQVVESNSGQIMNLYTESNGSYYPISYFKRVR